MVSVDPVRVLLIDDHALFRRGLALMLLALGAPIQVQEVDCCSQALAIGADQFDLVLMDWHMNNLDGLDELKGLASIKAHFETAAVVVVSGEEASSVIVAAMDNGASGFIPKSSSPEIMLKALQLVLSHGIYLPPQALNSARWAKTAAPSAPAKDKTTLIQGLSQRQSEVLRLALKGLPNKIIGRELDISDATVKTHLSVAYRMLGVKNRTEALYSLANQLD